MKNLIFIFILGLSGVVTSYGQGEIAFFDALKKNDMGTLDTYLEDVITFCLFEDQQMLPKQEAVAKLKKFLTAQNVTNVEVMHKGGSKDKKSQYKVAKISTSKADYRVFVYTSGGIGEKTVKEIRIDKF